MRAPRSTSDNRRFPAGPRTTSRPLAGRARSAAPTARKKCTGHMRAPVCVLYTCLYIYMRKYVLKRPATETRRHTIADAHIHARVHRVAAGVPARGIVGLSRASGPHTTVTRSATATRDDGTTSCRLFVLQFSERPRLSSPAEKCLPCAIDAHRPLSPRPCRLTCAEPENYPSRATGLRAIVAVKGWRDLPFKFRERGK